MTPRQLAMLLGPRGAVGRVVPVHARRGAGARTGRARGRARGDRRGGAAALRRRDRGAARAAGALARLPGARDDQRGAAVRAAVGRRAGDRRVAGRGPERDGAAVRRAGRRGLARPARDATRPRPGSCSAWPASRSSSGSSPFTIDLAFIAAVARLPRRRVRLRRRREPRARALRAASRRSRWRSASSSRPPPCCSRWSRSCPVRAAPDAVDVACVARARARVDGRRLPPLLPPARGARARPAA